MTESYNNFDPLNDLPVRVPPGYARLSPRAKQLYDLLPQTCWKTKETLAREMRCRTSNIKRLKDELEAARLIEIHYHHNGKRSNPRHELIKLSGIGTPICKHFKNPYSFDAWGNLDRNAQIECYIKSDWTIAPFGEREKRPVADFNGYWWEQMTPEAKMDFFYNHPELNVGMVVCPHCMVVDVDTKENDWIYSEGFESTLSVSTPRGYHFFFRNDSVVQTSVKRLPDIDIRGPGNYVVLPPSINSDGVPYEFANIARPRPLPVAFRQEWRKQDFKYSKFSSWQALPAVILLGTRNTTLWSYGRSLRCSGKSYYEIEVELLEANYQRCSPRLSNFEIVKLAAHVSEHPDRSSFV
jgi:hypothetical protein